MKNLPKSLNIMGKIYKVIYVQDMVKADAFRRRALWGQIDYHTRTIRVYTGQKGEERQYADIMDTLVHEILHGLLEDNKLVKNLVGKENNESFVDNLSILIVDTLRRNNLLK